MLSTLAVKGRAPMTGYARDLFGPAWLDADRNGCDTRSDLLGMYLTHIVHRPGTHECIVTSGTEVDPYTGRAIHYVRSEVPQIDIDHVVALGNAWATGAQQFPLKKRAALANDPLNLLPVDYAANRQKGDGDAATWLPPRKPFRCAYVARQISVKHKYGLWVTAPEKVAMARVLASCPGQRPIRDRWHEPVLVPVNVTAPTPEPAAAPAAEATRPAASGGAPYYSNCDAVRAAGRAPIHRGDPGYASGLDRDGDGVGCE